MINHTPARNTAGFTLLEMTVVLLIMALLLGGVLPTLSNRIEQQRISETRKQLEEIEQALVGYALAYGRLPCPAASSSNGAESFATGGSASDGNCSNFHDGYVPAAALGLNSADGYAIDSWGNRIHYAVTSSNSNAFTRAGGMNSTGLSALSPNLQVCSTATGITASSCASGSALTVSPGVPVVLYSTGKNGAFGGVGADESANPNLNSSNNDRVFVSHAPTVASSPNGEFDDIVTWLPAYILYYRMVEAGKLP